MLSHQMYEPMFLKTTPYRTCGWGSVDNCCDVMRRPTFCHNSVAAVEATQAPQSHHNIDKEETRLARMKRIFTGSLLMGRRPPAGPPLKSFGVHLDDLPLTNEGLPRVVVRITTFIEKYGLQMEGLFRLSGGNPKLVEQLKMSFDRTGDADLEGCGDVTSVAALLKLWLRDLPEPVVPAVTTAELVSLLQKYKGDTDEWCVETSRVLACSLRERNARLLRCVLRLLHRYQLRHSGQQVPQHAPVFAALLLSLDDAMPRLASPDTTAVTYALIANYAKVYDESMACGDVKMDGASTPETPRHYSAGKNKSLNAPTNNISETTPLSSSAAGSKKQRKRKDRQSSADRKFVRSNSEERPCKSSCGGGGNMSIGGAGGGGGGKDSIRRVSSHEDFSRSRAGHVAPRHSAHLMELISETAASIQMSTPVATARPLHERNSVVVRSVPNSTTTKNNNNNLNNNNLNLNNNNNNNNKVKSSSPSSTAAVAPEYNNNNNNGGSGDPLACVAVPWQTVCDSVRRDESLAVSVVCSPPPLALSQAADSHQLTDDESEHEKRRSSERFAPLGVGGHHAVMGRRSNGGDRRRRKVVSQRSNGGGSSSRSHRRHADRRSPRGGCGSGGGSVDDTDGNSSSKENEEEPPVQRRSTLMVVSPPSPRHPPPQPAPPLPPQASYSGEEEEESGEGGPPGGGGEETPASLSGSTSESDGSSELNEPLHGSDEQDDKADADERKNETVEGVVDGEEKNDVEDLEAEDDDEEVAEEVEGGEEEGEDEEDDQNDEPVLDLNRLHRNMDMSEPVPSRHDWSFAPQLPQPQQERLECDTSSLRSSATFAAGHRAFEAAQAVSAAAAATPPDQLPISGRTQISVIEHHHAKQIQTLKKRLKRYEEGFEREFGYKPSSADKMANPDTKKMCLTLSKLRRELKQLKSEASLCPSTSVSQLLFLSSGDRVSVSPAANGGVSAAKVIKEDIVHDLEKRLNDKRQAARRPSVLEEMSREQLADEKTAVQRALLQLEAVYGRPATREQRDLVRPLYDRYRSLKRLIARAVAAAKLKEGVAELGTILEHEQMDFSSSSPPPPSTSVAASIAVVSTPPPTLSVANATANGQRPTTPDYFENLHALPRNELLDQHKTTREEKKQLRRQLHEFEDEMESKMGRKLQREDRQPMDTVYTQYKHVKAKLRLIEALITKK